VGSAPSLVPSHSPANNAAEPFQPLCPETTMRTSRRLFALLALASLWTAPLLAADEDKAEKKKDKS